MRRPSPDWPHQYHLMEWFSVSGFFILLLKGLLDERYTLAAGGGNIGCG
jgi:hypothetical protein